MIIDYKKLFDEAYSKGARNGFNELSSLEVNPIKEFRFVEIMDKENLKTGYVGELAGVKVYTSKNLPNMKKKKTKKLSPIQKLKQELKNAEYTISCKIDNIRRKDDEIQALESKINGLESRVKSQEGFVEGRIHFLSKENDRLWHMIRIAMKDPIIESIAENNVQIDNGTMKGRFNAPDFQMGWDPTRRPDRTNLF